MLQLLLHVSTFAFLLRFLYDINIIIYLKIIPDNSRTRKHIYHMQNNSAESDYLRICNPV